MKPRDQAIKVLESNGYAFERNGKKHDIFYNAKLRCSIPLKRHDFDEGDLRYIQKEINHNQRDRC